MTSRQFQRISTVRIVLTLLLFAAPLACRAQASAGNNGNTFDPSQLNTRFPDKTVSMDHSDITQAQRRLRLLNVARQKAMISDAEKLLTLARALNAGVDASGTVLTATQRFKMAGDIEKLARNVKERMTFAISGEPSPATPFQSWPQ